MITFAWTLFVALGCLLHLHVSEQPVLWGVVLMVCAVQAGVWAETAYCELYYNLERLGMSSARVLKHLKRDWDKRQARRMAEEVGSPDTT